jgi:phospho-N-acetylmuramoyl-pentapeptide-transferase
MCGWSEKKVVAVFATVSLIFCAVALFGVLGRYGGM